MKEDRKKLNLVGKISYSEHGSKLPFFCVFAVLTKKRAPTFLYTFKPEVIYFKNLKNTL